jgi:folylpolyglutamate synthase
VCGVTSLGLDHVELLGHTLPEIAREKAGIFKPGRPAFMVPQPEDAMHALQVVADRVGTPLQLTKPLGEYALPGGKPARDLQLGLSGEHQRINAALAVTLAAQWEALSPVAEAMQGKVAQERARSVLEDGVIPGQYVTGLELAYWPGRGQILHDPVTTKNDAREAAVPEASPSTNGTRGAAPRVPRLSFYLDGAHTAESMAACAHWFADAAHAVPAAPGINTQRVLLFNCMQVRNLYVS